MERFKTTGQPARPQSRLSIVYRPIDEIRPNPRNPRKHSRSQIKRLARIIQELGVISPLLVDRDGNLLAGHARYEACQRLGLTEVPTISLEHLDRNQARALMLADNKLAELSTWNEVLLAEHLKELSQVLDFDIELTGFEIGEIDLSIEGLSKIEAEEHSADVLPAGHPSPAVSRVGDLWLLDRHRVFCGNALDEAAYDALMCGECAATVFTDPPYNVPIKGHVSGLGQIRHREFVMFSGEKSQAEYTEFLAKVLALHARHSHDGALHFICMDWRHLAELLAAGHSVYSQLKNICVWVKNHTCRY
jgi:hypothetical protein